jgi:phosphoglucomutase
VRHDYDELSASVATQVMQSLAGTMVELPGKTFGDYTGSAADEFSYQDPVDGSIAINQGLRIVFGDAARLIVRLSGTGTKGATLRLYLERYETQAASLGWKTSEALAPLVNLAEKLVRISEITGRRTPSVIT